MMRFTTEDLEVIKEIKTLIEKYKSEKGQLERDAS